MGLKKNKNKKRGFTLIELLVAMFILSIVLVGMVAVYTSAVEAYTKGRAVKFLVENVQYALNSISKDVRMGKIESSDPNCTGASASQECLMITRNATGEKVCYWIETGAYGWLGFVELGSSAVTCPVTSSSYSRLVDLDAIPNISEGKMEFVSDSGFYSLPTDEETVVTPEENRGWVEVNFNIQPVSGEEGMETDTIQVQTTVSSRDYGL